METINLAKLARGLILFGAAAWFVYGGVWLINGKPEITYFLAWHLSGVVPGSILKIYSKMEEKKAKEEE